MKQQSNPITQDYNELLKSNIERKQDLIKIIKSGEAVLFVGAGSSVRVGYPTWENLLKELKNEVIKLNNRHGSNTKYKEQFELSFSDCSEDFLDCAEKLKTEIYKINSGEKRYYNWLSRIFADKESTDDFHTILLSLPFRGILTTNYDSVLEAVLAKIDKKPLDGYSLIINDEFFMQINEFLLSMSDKEIPRKIAHLHGIIKVPSSIIFTRKDYEKAYGYLTPSNDSNLEELTKSSQLHTNIKDLTFIGSEWTIHRKLLWAVLATRHVVFIGFSMNDPYLEKMLDSVCDDLGRWDRPIHYAIRNISLKNHTCVGDFMDKANYLREEYSVETVFYEDSDDSHQGLAEIINEIAKECDQKAHDTPLHKLDSSSNESGHKKKDKNDIKLEHLSKISTEMDRRTGNVNKT
ncbi:SIR2 family protein [Candidatus Poribacteria bacterium]|nr:SIR2 family protein [Candidatus Poribacteria bacterium]